MNPNHDSHTGQFSSAPGGGAAGHNAGVGSDTIREHVAGQHRSFGSRVLSGAKTAGVAVGKIALVGAAAFAAGAAVHYGTKYAGEGMFGEGVKHAFNAATDAHVRAQQERARRMREQYGGFGAHGFGTSSSDGVSGMSSRAEYAKKRVAEENRKVAERSAEKRREDPTLRKARALAAKANDPSVTPAERAVFAAKASDMMKKRGKRA